jgi:photosystem II stability/assembly factor-like uncharacterized protein
MDEPTPLDRPSDADTADDSAPDHLSRRRFVLRAGQLGALTILGPRFDFTALPVHAPPGSSLAATGSTPATRAAITDLYSGLRWRMLGPFRGGRVAAATGVPGRPNEFYFGSVNGGVWKTVDAGRVWKPIFDGQPVASIGAIVVAPSAPDVVYVGSGESTLRDSVGFGNGMYKSVDAGKTWTHIGLDGTQHIGKVAVDPRNPNVVFVAAIGHLYASNPERGVFRSRDGGKTWKKVLGPNNDVGAVEVVIDPSNSNIIYAGLWNARRPPWYAYAPTNGPGGGIFKSTDGGDTWKRLTNGLPKDGIGRTGMAISPSNPRRVYAVVDCLVPDKVPSGGAEPEPPPGTGARVGAGGPPAPGQGGFYRSDDAGATWKKMSGDNALWGRGWYFEKVAVDPKNADIVYVPNVSVSRSMDGGQTWLPVRGSPGGDDYHQTWVSPDDSNTMIVASDQGTIITRNAKTPDPRDVTWSSWLNQPTAQIYHLSVDYREPYWVTGAQQDSGAVAVRSRGKFGEISMRDWEPVEAGGESGMTAGDPLNPGVIFGGTGQRWDLEFNRPVPGTTSPVTQGTDRADWTQPLVLSPADPHALYYASQFLYKSSDSAATWTRISPDLTRADPGVPANLDAAAAEHVDRNGKRGVIYAVSPSPITAPLLWIGTDDGLIQLTTDDGKNWRDVTPPAVTAWSRITGIEASRFDANVAYTSVDRHQLQDFEPYIYRTRDQGKSWQKITNGLPGGVYVHVVKEDSKRKGLLFAGTERGAFVSFDDGELWHPLQLDLPVTSVRDFAIHDNDLIVGTHGRGFWVIDDIATLRQVDDAVVHADAFLFKPSDTTYFPPGTDNGTPMQKDEAMAEGGPAGIAIDYFLGANAAGPVTIEILDASGTTLRTFSSEAVAAPVGRGGGRGGRGGGIPNTTALWRPAPVPFAKGAGMHRIEWPPVAAPVGGRGRGRGGGVALSGTFTAKLTVNGKSYQQSFVVKPAPRGRV